MHCEQKAKLIIMPAMFAALFAVVLMGPFYGAVIALVITLFSLLLCVMSRRMTAEREREKGAELAQLGEMKNIINRSGVLVFTWRMEPGKWPVEFVSENVADILGYSVGDFMSGRVEWSKITHPDDVPRLEKEVAQYLEKGDRKWSQEYRLITKSGGVKWFCDDNLALEDSDAGDA